MSIPLTTQGNTETEVKIDTNEGYTTYTSYDANWLPNVYPSAPVAQNIIIPEKKIDTQTKNIMETEDQLPKYFTIVDGQYINESPKDGIGCVAACKKNPHCKAWFCTIVIVFPIICLLLCAINYNNLCACKYTSFNNINTNTDVLQCNYVECSFPCLGSAFVGVWIFLFWLVPCFIGYLFYCCESFCCSSSYKYLKTIMEADEYKTYHSNVCNQAPSIWWHIECYHYETEHYTDSKGNHHTRQRKVTTYTASTTYQYNCWKDISGELQNIKEYKLTKLTNYKQFTFSDDYTKQDYNIKLNYWKSINTRDVYQNFTYGININGFKNKILIEAQPNTKPTQLNQNCYCLASLCLLTTCYRMWFASMSGRKEFVYNKSIKTYPKTVIIAVQQPMIIQQPIQQPIEQQWCCKNCNKMNIQSANFCGGCGQKPITTWNCMKCNNINDITANFCGGCGNPRKMQQVGWICNKCGDNNENNGNFCGKCGNGKNSVNMGNIIVPQKEQIPDNSYTDQTIKDDNLNKTDMGIDNAYWFCKQCSTENTPGSKRCFECDAEKVVRN